MYNQQESNLFLNASEDLRQKTAKSHETNGKSNWGRGLALPRDLVFNKTIVVSYHRK